MLNIPDLEKRWLHYKLKSYLPAFLIALLLIISSSVVYTFFPLFSSKKNDHIITNIATPLKKNISPKTEIKKRVPTTTSLFTKKELNTTTLSPSMDFMQELKIETNQPTSKPLQTKQVIKEEKIGTIAKVTKTARASIGNITIIKQDTKRDIQNILKRFQEEKNPALSLFLARKYYELGDYKAASKYALITNQLDKKIDESWIIFSKALVKMHHKEKAINILQRYIQSSQSTNAVILLENIQSGRFR